jgi:hypothetical protein
MTQIPAVDFDCDDREVGVHEWFAFWDSSRSWLAERGYTLYEYGCHWGDEYRGYVTFSTPKLSTPDKVDHPFAFSGGDSPSIPVPPLSACPIVRFVTFPISSTLTQLKGRVAYAQDALHRHVVLKLVKENSPEYQIARLLSSEPRLVSLDNFCGIIPAIGFLRLDHHSFIVMPRQDVFTSHNDSLIFNVSLQMG